MLLMSVTIWHFGKNLLAKCENANLAKQDKAANDDVSQEIIRIAPCVVMPSFFLANVNLNLDRTSKCVLKKEKVFEIKDILFQNLSNCPSVHEQATHELLVAAAYCWCCYCNNLLRVTGSSHFRKLWFTIGTIVIWDSYLWNLSWLCSSTPPPHHAIYRFTAQSSKISWSSLSYHSSSHFNILKNNSPISKNQRWQWDLTATPLTF